jgi:hypothetical protein
MKRTKLTGPTKEMLQGDRTTSSAGTGVTRTHDYTTHKFAMPKIAFDLSGFRKEQCEILRFVSWILDDVLLFGDPDGEARALGVRDLFLVMVG